jgi:CDP-diacylglycerol--glycerol-3-phosphate 3-phosphatidyltransferase
LTAANGLTLSRLGMAAGFAACLAKATAAGPPTGVWAVLLIAIALCSEATDVFDGMLARRTGTANRIGGILDPLCDSLSRLAMYFALALCGLVTIAVPLVMAGRDIVVAYVRIFSALTGGRTSARVSGKVKAIVQGTGAPLLVLIAWAGPTLSTEAHAGWLLWIAAAVIAVTLWSLADYVSGAAKDYRSDRRL